MDLAITPQPTEAERAAIVSALLQETETQRQVWHEPDGDDCEEFVKP